MICAKAARHSPNRKKSPFGRSRNCKQKMHSLHLLVPRVFCTWSLHPQFISDSLSFNGIVDLDLSYNSFEDSGLKLLCSIVEKSQVLRTLQLKRCQLREQSLKTVLRAIKGEFLLLLPSTSVRWCLIWWTDLRPVVVQEQSNVARMNLTVGPFELTDGVLLH